jgi:chromosome partitioning protein
MRPIAMINQKGGVGKTTTAVNVAAALARDGQRVLLVDLDPQAHATMHLGVELAPGEPCIYDVLVSGVDVADTLHEVSANLTLLPAQIDLVGAELELAPRPERELILRQALQPLRDRFDMLIVDCPPSLGTLTINALAAVEEVVIPLQAHFLALQGLGRLLETVTLVREILNPPLRVVGVALCMYEKGTRLAQEVNADVRRFMANASPDDAWHGARVFDATIRRNVKLAECPSFGQTIFDYAPSSHGAEDYSALARALRTVPSSSAKEDADVVDRAAENLAASAPEQTPNGETADQREAEVGEQRVIREAVAEAGSVVPAGSRTATGAGTSPPDPLSAPPPPDSRASVTTDAAP